jgi:dihydrofolate reductase
MSSVKLQMNINLDGKWDNGLTDFSIANLTNVGCILLGRITAEGFIPYWQNIANDPNDSLYQLGKALTDIPKVVISNSMKTSLWDNTTVAHGNISEVVKTLKRKDGKSVIVYGGDSFVTSLLQHELIDEFYLLVNPAAIGNGQQTFNPLKNQLPLNLKECKSFGCGVVLFHYTMNGIDEKGHSI